MKTLLAILVSLAAIACADTVHDAQVGSAQAVDFGQGWKASAYPLYWTGSQFTSGPPGQLDNFMVLGTNINFGPEVFTGDPRPDKTKPGYWLALEDSFDDHVTFQLSLKHGEGLHRNYMIAEIPKNGSGGAWQFRGRLFAVEGYTGANRMFSVREDERAVRLHRNTMPNTYAAESYTLQFEGQRQDGSIFLVGLRALPDGSLGFVKADGTVTVLAGP